MQQRSITVEELSKKLKPLFGNKIDELYLKYSIADSLEEKNEIAQILKLLYEKNLNKLLDSSILLEPPIKQNIQGEYPLAQVEYNGKELFSFGLNEKDWPRHMCITGMSGSGKTTFAFKVLDNFIKKQKPFLVLDWKKSFRPLTNIKRDLLTFTVGNEKVSNLFKMNINIPPKGVSPKEWINVLCDILTESFGASFGAHKVLLETLDEIFEKWEVYKGGKHYPNWQHVKKMLEIRSKEARGRETEWFESALRIASVLTFGSFGKVINYDGKKSLPIEDLFDKQVVFELNSLGNIEKKFFCEFVLTYIYKLKKAQERKDNEGFNYAILVDEAHNVFLKNKTNFIAESVTDMVYREMREYGISLICLDQHISKLSDTVKGNSACSIAFQQQLPEDIREISSLMQLEDKRESFSRIPVGSAIVKLSERHTSPFLVKIPFTDLRNQTLSDEKIGQRMDCILQSFDIEKNDQEFKQDLIGEKAEISESKVEIPIAQKEQIIEIVEQPTEQLIEQKTRIEEEPKPKEILLTKTQEVLYNFVLKKLDQGLEFKKIENMLEKGTSENLYDLSDILIVINKALKEKLGKDISTETKLKSVLAIQEADSKEDLSKEENKFLSFLEVNPDHEDSTIEIYKKVGVSTRKGNIIKNKLLEKGLIKIEEKKYLKGWKKLIRPSLSYSLTN